ncbi:MBL fold metallo-hydrolase [Pseudanabaena sp. FACHB-2040]|uniref:MBL fold metallo-hydrolase n=1 Tax=Pseudanabaena sp. FACHB-2040 TaxID=2692859 RepID=UPI001683F677|nr:MBL fold metallo-hydrolase [Pseudanabaena sp. FACHB-2040]MBD2257541.1 MBL fold metallo-hydrolase [Pseudanabaena sp. FACHB-2040]
MTESEIAPLKENKSAVVFDKETRDLEVPGGFTARFWGVRGSVPTPGADTLKYGGNTSCVEVLVGGQRLIFDGGTGLRSLGKHLARQPSDVEARIFFTHTHWDRIQGFPFFLPAFKTGNSFHIYGAPAHNGASIKQSLTEQMLRPNFFTPLQQMQAQLVFHNINAGSVIPLAEVVIETIGLNHCTGALGYRVSWQGHSLVYATDTDHSQHRVDPNLMYLAAGADVLILDGTYADPDYYGHGAQGVVPWEVGVETAKSANVKELILFHHDPRHDDDCLDQLELKIQGHFPNAYLAREGMVLKVV